MIPPPDPSGPISVFDSGVGGLSVPRHLLTRLPREDLLFVADSGHAPYGDRSLASGNAAPWDEAQEPPE